MQPTSAAGVLGIGAAAFLLSYDALHSLALASGVRPGLARIWGTATRGRDLAER